MRFLFKDLAVALLAFLGIVSDFNFVDIPWWVFIIVLVSYAGLRLADKDGNEV